MPQQILANLLRSEPICCVNLTTALIRPAVNMRFAILLVIFAAVFVLGRPLEDHAQNISTYQALDASDKGKIHGFLSKVAGHVKSAATAVAAHISSALKGKKKAAPVAAAPVADAAADAPVDAPADAAAADAPTEDAA
ncbi:hypothetical protein ONZ45_g10534 [Pleurotus djamor]|nr:hypothetical protein ONZ45_g10534 [Pleurotus djamor]